MTGGMHYREPVSIAMAFDPGGTIGATTVALALRDATLWLDRRENPMSYSQPGTKH